MTNIAKSTSRSRSGAVQRAPADAAHTKQLMQELNSALKGFFESYDRARDEAQKKRIAEKIALAVKVHHVLHEDAA